MKLTLKVFHLCWKSLVYALKHAFFYYLKYQKTRICHNFKCFTCLTNYSTYGKFSAMQNKDLYCNWWSYSIVSLTGRSWYRATKVKGSVMISANRG